MSKCFKQASNFQNTKPRGSIGPIIDFELCHIFAIQLGTANILPLIVNLRLYMWTSIGCHGDICFQKLER